MVMLLLLLLLFPTLLFRLVCVEDILSPFFFFDAVSMWKVCRTYAVLESYLSPLVKPWLKREGLSRQKLDNLIRHIEPAAYLLHTFFTIYTFFVIYYNEESMQKVCNSFVSTESFGCILSSTESSTYGYSAGLGLRQDNSKGSNTSPPDLIDSSRSYAAYFLYAAVGMFAIYIVAFPRDTTQKPGNASSEERNDVREAPETISVTKSMPSYGAVLWVSSSWSVEPYIELHTILYVTL